MRISNQSINKYLFNTCYVHSIGKSWGEFRNCKAVSLGEVIRKTSGNVIPDRSYPQRLCFFRENRASLVRGDFPEELKLDLGLEE